MLKATELRIGNYIYLKNKQIGKLEIIDPVNNFYGITGYLESYSFDELKPIKLTEELILKCGFIKLDDYEIYNRYTGKWWYQIEKHPSLKKGYIFFIDIYGISAPPSLKLQYLHTLQNYYFTFTGKELKINL